MVGGMLRHMKSLRSMRRDNGWIHTLLEEAENERMHLLTFLQLRQPGFVFRGLVLLSQVLPLLLLMSLLFFSCRSSSSHVLLMLLLFFSRCTSSSSEAWLGPAPGSSYVDPLLLICFSSSHVAPLHLPRPGAAQPDFCLSSSPIISLLLLHRRFLSWCP